MLCGEGSGDFRSPYTSVPFITHGCVTCYLCLDCPLLSTFGYRLTDMTGVNYANLLTGMSGVNSVKVYLTD